MSSAAHILFFHCSVPFRVQLIRAYLLTSTPMAAAVSSFTTTAFSFKTSTGTSQTGVPVRTFSSMSAVWVPGLV